MRCESEGEGPPIVLLPALGCDSRMWGPVTKTLARRFTVIRPETGNCGTLAEAAEGVVGELASRRLTRVGLAGLSMGGYVAFELLRLWPQVVRSAALLDTTAFPDTADRREKRHEVLLLLREGRFEEVLEAFVTSLLPPDHAGEGPTRDLLLTMARDLGPEAFARDMEAILKRGSFEDVLQLVRVPLLFVAGEHDSLTPPAVARQMAAEVPGSRLTVVAGAGHMSALEQPEEVAELLEAFFGSTLSD